jgi:Cu+-exporting ATPase
MRSLVLMVAAAGCAGPALHERSAAGSALDPAASATARAPVATTLASADPLLARDCELPTAPFVPCPAPVADEPPPPHQHQEPPPPPTAPAPVPTTRAPRPSKVKDPICGMTIDPAKAAGGSVTRNGVTTHFCSATCKRTFLARVADGGTP